MTQEVKVLIGIGVLTVAILVGAVFFLSKSSPPISNSTPTASMDPKLLIREDSYKIATDSAKVTIVEFGDYQCPACRQAYPTVKRVIKDYSGKINFVFRNFPLPQHKNAQISAEAAEAAGVQGKFWQMHDKLYENQDQWAESDQPLDVFLNYATELSLDVTKFQTDVIDKRYIQKITQDQNDGDGLGINATPTFFINQQKIEGVPSYDDFKNKIDSELAK